MLLKEGVGVFTSDGQKVGEIERVVTDPANEKVTHVVVRKGGLFKKDKVVPISLVGNATVDRVTMREDAKDLEALPNFEKTHYIPISTVETQADKESDASTPLYWYPPTGYIWWGAGGGPAHLWRITSACM
jgi:uncharacterized protein YrrD